MAQAQNIPIAKSMLDYGVFVSATSGRKIQKSVPAASASPVQKVAPARPAVSLKKKFTLADGFVLDDEATKEALLGDFELDENITPPVTRQDEIRNMLKADKKTLEQEKKAIKLIQKAEEREKRKKAREKKILNPIGLKMMIIITILMFAAVGSVTYIVSFFMTQDIRTSAEENNLAINSRTATSCENSLNAAVSNVGMFLDLLKSAGENDVEVRAMEAMFFDRNKDIAAVYLPGSNQLFASNAFLISREIERETVLSYMQQETESVEKAQNGSFEMLNASLFFNVPVIAMFYPVAYSAENNAVAVLLSADELGETFSASKVNQPFLVNNDGIILVHSDVSLQMNGSDQSENPIVKEMLASELSDSQTTYLDATGEEYIGAYKRLNMGNGMVITTVKTAIVLEGIRKQTVRNVYIMMAILAIAVMVVYFFAKSLSKPLKLLTDIANEINRGNFNTDLFDELSTHRVDEIGVLSKSTMNEREILNMVSRLTNKGVTKAVITKEIDFEPHLKDVTIFFSDIRGFTAISDGFKNRFGERSAAEIISFLNDYMSRMVTCITRTGGTVDKFEGDAIMAAWGVLRNDGLEWERMSEHSVTRAIKEDAHDRYIREDALSAITCCIAMRYSLMKYNKDAAAFTEAHKDEPLAQYKPHIQIGAGLNSGRATVGFMGSFDKMEFTSIGDAVNFASRTEASNKPCGTDILITEDTLALLKRDYIRCKENDFTLKPENEKNEIVVEQIPVEFEVKGKGKQHFYGVVNMPHFDIAEFFLPTDPDFEVDEDCEKSVGPKGPKTLSEMRKLLGIKEPNFGQVNLDAEENKIQVASK